MDSNKKGFSDKNFFQPSVRSNIIKEMMKYSAMSQQNIADCLNCSLPSLRNKFSRDSFSLYDFIVICDACGFCFNISYGSYEDMNTAKDCLENVTSDLYNVVSDSEEVSDAIGESYDDADLALENIENFESFFEFYPENILTLRECSRLEQIKNSIAQKKYGSIVDNLSPKEQLDLLTFLQEKQNNQSNDD